MKTTILTFFILATSLFVTGQTRTFTVGGPNDRVTIPSNHLVGSDGKSFVNEHAFPVGIYAWTKTDDNSTAFIRDGAALVQAGRYLFSVGGWSPDSTPTTNSEVYRYALDIKSTTKLSNAPWEGRHTFGFASNKDTVYVFGGDFQLGHYQRDMWKGVLSGDTLIWSLVNNNLPWGRRALYGTVVHQGSIYVVGGQDSTFTAGNGFADVWRSKDWGRTWSQIATGLNQFKKNMYGTLASFDGYIYAVGGGVYDATNPTYDSTVYRSLDGVTWERLPDAPWPGRQYGATLNYHGQLFVTTGANPNSPSADVRENLNDTWAMDRDGNWTQVLNLNGKPTARHAAAYAVYRGKLVLSTGNFYNENNTWALSPARALTADDDGFTYAKYFWVDTDYSTGLVINKTNNNRGKENYVDLYLNGQKLGDVGIGVNGEVILATATPGQEIYYKVAGDEHMIYHEGNLDLGAIGAGNTVTGKYLPVDSAGTGYSNLSVDKFYYTKSDSFVTVYGKLGIETSGAGTVELLLDLPFIPSAASHIIGHGSVELNPSNSPTYAPALSLITFGRTPVNNRISVAVIASGSTINSDTINFSFTYISSE